MSASPFAVITRGDPADVSVPVGWSTIAIDEIPADPFDLSDRRIVVTAAVGDADCAAGALLAASRGCSIAASVTLPDAAREAFLDDLARLVSIEPSAASGATLAPDQVELLSRLAGGATVKHAADQLGLSRRSATRRLTDAKRVLGVSSTSAAIKAVRSA